MGGREKGVCVGEGRGGGSPVMSAGMAATLVRVRMVGRVKT